MKFAVGNLKMNILSPQERKRYLESFKKELRGKKIKDSGIILCPSAIHLESFVDGLRNKKVKFGAQNIFCKDKGSYTGEISASMVKNFGGDYVIVGHSERRKIFNETNEIANEKIKLALKHSLVPIYCIGESKTERQVGMTKDVIISQIQEGLKEISGFRAEKIIFAYEPRWAVGTDEIPSSNEVMEVRILIQKILIEKYGSKSSEKMKILYGGSVNSKWVKDLCIDPGMDGVLVGRESLVPNEFIKIAELISNS